MNNSSWVLVPVAAIVIPASLAHATVYLTPEQAQQVIFPKATFTKSFITLTDAQVKEIEKRSGVNVRDKEVQGWKASTGGFFILDRIIGKHEFINVAYGLNANGSFKDVEILDYKETYGFQVRDADWRQQFAGKTSTSLIGLGKDIKNISGATLSCKHIADGIKRILVTYAVAGEAGANKENVDKSGEE